MVETKIILDVLIALLGVAGLGIAWYIRSRKKAHRHLACPIGGRCDQVVTSRYSRFLGIPVELLGIGYYGVITLSYLGFALFNHTPASFFVFAVVVLSTAAILFSAYLTAIQVFTLRQFCTWCLASAGICVGIFGLSVWNSGHQLTGLLAQYEPIVRPLHLLGFGLGIGAATSSDVFFGRFLKNYRLSPRESHILHYFSQIIWFALGIIVISGLALYLPYAEHLNDSGKFLAKMTVVGVLVTNGVLLSIYLQPKLSEIFFGGHSERDPRSILRLRRLAFAGGAISATSWYSAFVLGAARSIPWSYETIVGIYLLVLVTAITTSQVVERVYTRRAPSHIHVSHITD